MKYKLFLLLSIFSLVSVFSVSAQNKKSEEERRKDLEAFREKRVAYITKELELTPEEAKSFWPLCNELEGKKFQLNRTLRQEFRKVREARAAGKQISDTEYESIVSLDFETRTKEIQLEEEYFKKFKKILPAEKLYKYQRAEQRFAREMFGGNQRR